MKKPLTVLLFVVIASAFALAACGGGQAEAPKGTAIPTPPAEYAGLTNPDAGKAAEAEAGKTVYQTNCATCHGENGKGDGPAAAGLDPKPTDLAAQQKQLSDAYLFWRISEGGSAEPFNSSMPAWKGVLTKDQIWQVITYIRTF